MSRRSARTTVVPDLVGLPACDAQDAALDAGLLPEEVDAHGRQTGLDGLVVARQRPRPGARLSTGSPVRLWYQPLPPRDTDGPDDDDPGGGGGGGSSRSHGPRPLVPAGTKP